jgi:periplasmic protein TonB
MLRIVLTPSTVSSVKGMSLLMLLLAFVTVNRAIGQIDTVASPKLLTAPDTIADKLRNQAIICHVLPMPEYPGGEEALYAYLKKSLRYPPGKQGKVFVGFIIEADGSLNDIGILKGSDPLLDQEALRVVNEMPSWKPGQQDGKPVRVRYSLPINFKSRE